MVLIISERKCFEVPSNPCAERIVRSLKEANWDLDTLIEEEGLCGVIGETVLKVVEILCREDTDVSDLTIEANNVIEGMLMRGILRLLGIVARIRLRPGGGTTRRDLERARREMRIITALADA